MTKLVHLTRENAFELVSQIVKSTNRGPMLKSTYKIWNWSGTVSDLVNSFKLPVTGARIKSLLTHPLSFKIADEKELPRFIPIGQKSAQDSEVLSLIPTASNNFQDNTQIEFRKVQGIQWLKTDLALLPALLVG